MSPLLVLALACTPDPVDVTVTVDYSTADLDGDTFVGTDDCDDTDALVFPGADERCNDVDDDCDGDVDEDLFDTWYLDRDGDSFGAPATAYDACAALPGSVNDGTDCDDLEATVYPGAPERCNNVDDDCNDVVDDDLVTTWYLDRDGDGHGDADSTFDSCDPGFDTTDVAGDCDDWDRDVNPDATEVCNDIDDNCDSAVDEGLDQTWYADADGDGWGDAATSVDACAAPAGFVSDDTDCDDGASRLHLCDSSEDLDGDGFSEDAGDCDETAADVSPAAVETCNNGIDDDCDGTTNCEWIGVYDRADATHRMTATDTDWWYRETVAGGPLASSGGNRIAVTAEHVPTNQLHIHLIEDVSLGNLEDSSAARVTSGATSRFGAHITIGDVTNDGQADLLFSRNRLTAIVPGPIDSDVNAGSAHILTRPADTNDHEPVASIGDVTGDGIDDVAVVGFFSGANESITIYHGPITDSVGYSNADTIIRDNLYDYIIKADGDLNGDGVNDLLADSGNDRGVMFGPIATGTMTEFESDVSVAGAYEAATIGDFDGDGKDDIAVGEYIFCDSLSSVGSYAPGNATAFADENLIDEYSGGNTNTDWERGHADDLNMDGTSDLMLQGGSLHILFHGPLEGTLALDEATVLAPPYASYSDPYLAFLPGDADNDGIPDIVGLERWDLWTFSGDTF